MSPLLYQTLLLAHLLAVTLWVGGMFFAHFVLRPAAAAQLAPPQRLALMHDALGRFFGFVTPAAALAVLSGAAMMLSFDLRAVPRLWHGMALLGGVMALVYAFIRLRLYVGLGRALQAQDLPAAGAALARVRGLVSLNLGLGVASYAAAAFARMGA